MTSATADAKALALDKEALAREKAGGQGEIARLQKEVARPDPLLRLNHEHSYYP